MDKFNFAKCVREFGHLKGLHRETSTERRDLERK